MSWIEHVQVWCPSDHFSCQKVGLPRRHFCHGEIRYPYWNPKKHTTEILLGENHGFPGQLISIPLFKPVPSYAWSCCLWFHFYFSFVFILEWLGVGGKNRIHSVEEQFHFFVFVSHLEYVAVKEKIYRMRSVGEQFLPMLLHSYITCITCITCITYITYTLTHTDILLHKTASGSYLTMTYSRPQ